MWKMNTGQMLACVFIREHVLPHDFHGQSHWNIKCEFHNTCREQIGIEYEDLCADVLF